MTKQTTPEDIEIMIAHQDQQIQELNDVVIAQGREIDALKKYLKDQKSKIEALENNIGELGSNEPMSATDEAALNKPPHY